MERREYSDVLAQGIMAVNAERDLGAIYKTFIVNPVRAGMSAKDASRHCPESERTIRRWVKTADEEGFEALRPKERPGRARRLSEEQRHAIKGALEKEPNQCGYAEWNGKTLSDYILKAYQVTLGVRQCQRLFRELNYALIRPQIHPYHKADDAEREEFKKTEKSPK